MTISFGAPVKNARIIKTNLGKGHGLAFTFSISLDYGPGSGRGQTAGHLDLSSWAGAIPMLAAILDVVGVESWEELLDKYVRVKATHEKVFAIGNIVEDKWLDFGEFAKKYQVSGGGSTMFTTMSSTAEGCRQSRPSPQIFSITEDKWLDLDPQAVLTAGKVRGTGHIQSKIENLRDAIGQQIFVVTPEMTDDEKETANNWNPILKSWLRNIDVILYEFLKIELDEPERYIEERKVLRAAQHYLLTQSQGAHKEILYRIDEVLKTRSYPSGPGLLYDVLLDVKDYLLKYAGQYIHNPADEGAKELPGIIQQIDNVLGYGYRDLDKMKRDLDAAGHPSCDYKDEDIPDAHRRLLPHLYFGSFGPHGEMKDTARKDSDSIIDQENRQEMCYRFIGGTDVERSFCTIDMVGKKRKFKIHINDEFGITSCVNPESVNPKIKADKATYRTEYIETSAEDSLVELPEFSQILEVDYVFVRPGGLTTFIGSSDRLREFSVLQDAYREAVKRGDNPRKWLNELYKTDDTALKIWLSSFPSPEHFGTIKKRYKLLIKGLKK